MIADKPEALDDDSADPLNVRRSILSYPILSYPVLSYLILGILALASYNIIAGTV